VEICDAAWRLSFSEFAPPPIPFTPSPTMRAKLSRVSGETMKIIEALKSTPRD